MLFLMMIACTVFSLPSEYDRRKAEYDYFTWGPLYEIECYSGDTQIYSGTTAGHYSCIGYCAGFEFVEYESGDKIVVTGACKVRDDSKWK